MLAVVSLAAASGDDCVPIEYDKVMIHQDSAVAFASAVVAVAGGQHSLLLCNLTEDVGHVDVTVSPSFGGTAEFLSLTWLRPPRPAPPPPERIAEAARRVAELEVAHRAAVAAAEAARDTRVVYSRAGDMLTEHPVALDKTLEGGVYVDAIAAVVERTAAAADAAAKAKAAELAAGEALAVAVRELAALRTPPDPRSGEARRMPLVTLSSSGSGLVRVVLRHVVKMWWAPRYEIRVDTAARKAKARTTPPLLQPALILQSYCPTAQSRPLRP